MRARSRIGLRQAPRASEGSHGRACILQRPEGRARPPPPSPRVLQIRATLRHAYRQAPRLVLSLSGGERHRALRRSEREAGVGVGSGE